MSGKVRFSVVVPLYNKEKCITSTLSSVLGQEFHDYEVVVVNDGSLDDSVARVREISTDRVNIYNKDNGGVSSSRNMGIDESNAEWIAFLDADDLWSPSHLSHLDELISRFPEVCMVSSASKKVAPGFSLDCSVICPDDYSVSNNFFRGSQGGSFSVHSSSVAIRREVFDELGGFLPYSSGEDVEMWARVALRHKVVMSDLCTSYYRRDPDEGLSRDAFVETSRNMVSDESLGIGSTPVLRMLKEKIEKKEICLDGDIKTYVAERLKVGAKIRLHQGNVDGLKKLINHPDWKKFCSPCGYDLLKYLPGSIVLAMRDVYLNLKNKKPGSKSV
ncbi:glycosyltransferase family 2 protein [Halomonas sp. M4R1S46]|uniref:glycosyltransferase family 2 protein n=1 Tax=Halomonas sp. M4R1S46 TaxID=2982692 RepID=UPI0021E37EA5|nr:glycosyltransferase family A protein [Halomonas sp. M4R1S46]UYG06325.1 glycosyltransferase family 2 protein [Halomonas sp. M4R1S46]